MVTVGGTAPPLYQASGNYLCLIEWYGEGAVPPREYLLCQMLVTDGKKKEQADLQPEE